MTFNIELLRPEDYPRFKALLNQGRHPAWVGPETAKRHAVNGGMLAASFGGRDIAAILVNPRQSVLLALNVHPDHRSHGLGGALVEYLRPNFARVLFERVDWFVKRGYQPIGEPKVGRTLRTQIMVRKDIISMAGRVSHAFKDGCRCADCLRQSAEAKSEGNNGR